MVIKKYEKIFESLKPIEPPSDLFDKIILKIQKEKERREKRVFLFKIIILFLISGTFLPFSSWIFLNQIKNSGILYFISLALSDWWLFLTFWKDFCWAILEALPLLGITIFIFNLTLLVSSTHFSLKKRKLYKLNY